MQQSTFLSSALACVAFELLKLLGTEIHGRFCFWSSSKLFLELFNFCVTLVPMVCIPMVCIPGVYREYTGSIPMVCIPGVYREYTYGMYTGSTPGVHREYTGSTPGVHREHTGSSTNFFDDFFG